MKKTFIISAIAAISLLTACNSQTEIVENVEQQSIYKERAYQDLGKELETFNSEFISNHYANRSFFGNLFKNIGNFFKADFIAIRSIKDINNDVISRGTPDPTRIGLSLVGSIGASIDAVKNEKSNNHISYAISSSDEDELFNSVYATHLEPIALVITIMKL